MELALRIALLGIIVAVGCGMDARSPVQGVVFSPPDRAFSIRFPDAPFRKTIPLGNGYDGEMYAVDYGNRAYIVMRSPMVEEVSNIEELLIIGRDRAVAKAQGTLLNDRDFEMKGHLAKEFVFVTPKGLIQRVQIFIVQSELIQVIATFPTDEEGSSIIDTFFTSFQLRH